MPLQIDELMQGNPGLKSRFSERLFFPDFSKEDSCKLFRSQLGKKHDLSLSEQAEEALPGLMEQVCGKAEGGQGDASGLVLLPLNLTALLALSHPAAHRGSRLVQRPRHRDLC